MTTSVLELCLMLYCSRCECLLSIFRCIYICTFINSSTLLIWMFYIIFLFLSSFRVTIYQHLHVNNYICITLLCVVTWFELYTECHNIYWIYPCCNCMLELWCWSAYHVRQNPNKLQIIQRLRVIIVWNIQLNSRRIEVQNITLFVLFHFKFLQNLHLYSSSWFVVKF